MDEWFSLDHDHGQIEKRICHFGQIWETESIFKRYLFVNCFTYLLWVLLYDIFLNILLYRIILWYYNNIQYSFCNRQPNIILNVVIEFSNLNKWKQFLDEKNAIVLQLQKTFMTSRPSFKHSPFSKHSTSTRRTSQMWIRMGKQ